MRRRQAFPIEPHVRLILQQFLMVARVAFAVPRTFGERSVPALEAGESIQKPVAFAFDVARHGVGSAVQFAC